MKNITNITNITIRFDHDETGKVDTKSMHLSVGTLPPKDFTGKVTYDDGDVFYYKNRRFHRENNLPAVEYTCGSRFYYVEGQHHRIDGPAVDVVDGQKEYWVYGKKVSKEAHDLLVNMLKLKEIKIV